MFTLKTLIRHNMLTATTLQQLCEFNTSIGIKCNNYANLINCMNC